MRSATFADGGKPDPKSPNDEERITPIETYPTSHCSYCDGTQTTTVLRVPIPIFPKAGLLRGGLFISSERVTWDWPGGIFLGATPDLRGDNRGFDPAALSRDFRAFFRFNFRRGLATIRVAPTCPVDEPCQSALPWRDGNDISVSRYGDHGISVDFSLTNSVYGGGLLGDVLMAQSIDGNIKIEPGDSGATSISVDREGFPALELYQTGAAGGASVSVQQPQMQPKDLACCGRYIDTYYPS